MPVINKVERDALQVGDHVYTWRKYYTYAHHGIYIGENQIIHIRVEGSSSSSSSSSAAGTVPACSKCPQAALRKSGVVQSCLDCFLGEGILRRYRYGVSAKRFRMSRAGTCTTVHSPPSADIIVRRAQELLQNGAPPQEYSLLSNNCEHFALYCTTGLWRMPGGQTSSIGVVPVVAALTALAAQAVTNLFKDRIPEDKNRD